MGAFKLAFRGERKVAVVALTKLEEEFKKVAALGAVVTISQLYSYLTQVTEERARQLASASPLYEATVSAKTALYTPAGYLVVEATCNSEDVAGSRWLCLPAIEKVDGDALPSFKRMIECMQHSAAPEPEQKHQLAMLIYGILTAPAGITRCLNAVQVAGFLAGVCIANTGPANALLLRHSPEQQARGMASGEWENAKANAVRPWRTHAFHTCTTGLHHVHCVIVLFARVAGSSVCLAQLCGLSPFALNFALPRCTPSPLYLDAQPKPCASTRSACNPRCM